MIRILLQAMRLVSVDKLTRQELEDVFDFYSKFARRDKATFLKGLGATTKVGRCFDADGRIVAFWAIDYIDTETGSKKSRAFWGKWAAVDRNYRGCRLLEIAGLCTYLRNRLAHPRMGFYFFFTGTTYYSYLMLEKNFKEYFPRIDRTTPGYLLALCKSFGERIGNITWDGDVGVLVRHYDVSYREGLVSDLDGASGCPSIAAYHQLNPNQDRGDSLVCIVPMDRTNLAHVAGRTAKTLWRRTRLWR